MPVCDCVWRCSLLRTTLADGRCAQRGLSNVVNSVAVLAAVG